MSMVPFMPKFSDSSNSSNSGPSVQQQNNQNSQNVLVGALCNQFVKNNIKGSNSSTYDGVLDNLCSNQQVGITNIYNSNSTAQTQQANNVDQTAEVITKKLSGQEGGDYKEPYFLKGVKGFAKLYSTPLRMGYNAITSLTGKSKNTPVVEQTPEEEPRKKHSKKKRRKKRRDKKKKSKKKKQRQESLEEQILRAENEIQKENDGKNKIVENIKNSLNNNTLDIYKKS